MSTWATPRAKAPSVAGRITMTSSALFEVLWYSVAIVMTFAPRSRASEIQ